MFTLQSPVRDVIDSLAVIGNAEGIIPDTCSFLMRLDEFLVDHPSVISVADIISAGLEHLHESVLFACANVVCMAKLRVQCNTEMLLALTACGLYSDMGGYLLAYCLPENLTRDEFLDRWPRLTVEDIATLDASHWRLTRSD